MYSVPNDPLLIGVKINWSGVSSYTVGFVITTNGDPLVPAYIIPVVVVLNLDADSIVAAIVSPFLPVHVRPTLIPFLYKAVWLPVILIIVFNPESIPDIVRIFDVYTWLTSAHVMVFKTNNVGVLLINSDWAIYLVASYGSLVYTKFIPLSYQIILVWNHNPVP